MLALSPPLIDVVAARLHALADPARIKLLLALQDGPRSVQELADRFDTEHRNASYNLNLLLREGFVTRRKDGKRSLYEIADFTALKLLDQSANSAKAHIEELADSILSVD